MFKLTGVTAPTDMTRASVPILQKLRPGAAISVAAGHKLWICPVLNATAQKAGGFIEAKGTPGQLERLQSLEKPQRG